MISAIFSGLVPRASCALKTAATPRKLDVAGPTDQGRPNRAESDTGGETSILN